MVQLVKVKSLLNATATRLAIEKMVHQIHAEFDETGRSIEETVLVGIKRRGVPLACRLAETYSRLYGPLLSVGEADTTFYTDELEYVASVPLCRGIDLPPGNFANVILVDDVLYTRRTAYQTMKRVLEMYRPRAVYLAVLIDRGWAELPIQANYVGQEFETTAEDVVHVHFPETDPEVGEDNVDLMRKVPQAAAV